MRQGNVKGGGGQTRCSMLKEYLRHVTNILRSRKLFALFVNIALKNEFSRWALTMLRGLRFLALKRRDMLSFFTGGTSRNGSFDKLSRCHFERKI